MSEKKKDKKQTEEKTETKTTKKGVLNGTPLDAVFETVEKITKPKKSG